MTLKIDLHVHSRRGTFDGHREGEYGSAFMVVDCKPGDASDIPSLTRAFSSYEWKLQQT